MRTILLALLVSAVAVGAASPFECIITSDRATYAVGEVPKITVRILNKSGKEVVLVGSLDGSTVGWRFPNCQLEILDAAGNPVKDTVSRCGHMNNLSTNDFVVVPAGGAFDPFGPGFFRPAEFHRFPVTASGEHTVRFIYSTSAEIVDFFGDERRGSETVSPEIHRLFKRVPKLDLKSNKLKLRFTAKPE